jgi:NADH-quinone oxidoreductase subunit N
MVSLVYGRRDTRLSGKCCVASFFTLNLTFALLGMFVISGHNFLVIYMGLELMTLSIRWWRAAPDSWQRLQKRMKYFAGRMASGFLL